MPHSVTRQRDVVVSSRMLTTLQRFWLLGLFLTVCQSSLVAQTDPLPLDGRDGRDLSVRQFTPVQKVRLIDRTPVAARFAVVDVHTHFLFRQRGNREALDDFVETMDRHQIAVCISLDGKLGATLKEHHRFLRDAYPDRFLVFAHLDWRGIGQSTRPETWACNQPGWPEKVARQLGEAKQAGLIHGLKFFKRFGLGHRDRAGALIRIDDHRFDPIWEACGKWKLPVIIHTGDPAAFFDPIGPENERWEELSRHPDWSFADPKFPRREELLAARNRVIGRHPETQFIGAHLAGNPEDLEAVGHWLDQYPNLSVEFASRISELGRQDRRAREFLIRYQDRVLFGTDGPWPEKRLYAYWRFLETFDESFDYSEKIPPPQGLWRIDGVGLPKEVLQKIYSGNTIKLIPALEPMLRRVELQWDETQSDD